MKIKKLIFFCMLGAYLSAPSAASDDSALSGTIHDALGMAKNDAQAMARLTTGGDRWHFGRAVQFLDTARAVGFSSRDPEPFLSEARQAMRALELVRAGRRDALIVESRIVAGIRIAASKRIEEVEGGLSGISDTTAKEEVRRRVRQARQDYVHATLAADAERFPKALSYFWLVFERFCPADTPLMSGSEIMHVFQLSLTQGESAVQETVDAGRRYLTAGDIDRGGYLVLESVEVLIASGDYQNAELLVREFRDILRGILMSNLLASGDELLDQGRLIDAVRAYRTAYSATLR